MQPESTAELAKENRCSIALQRAKDGTYYWDLKLYFEAGDDDAQADALSRLAVIDNQLRATFR